MHTLLIQCINTRGKINSQSTVPVGVGHHLFLPPPRFAVANHSDCAVFLRGFWFPSAFHIISPISSIGSIMPYTTLGVRLNTCIRIVLHTAFSCCVMTAIKYPEVKFVFQKRNTRGRAGMVSSKTFFFKFCE